MAKIILKNVGIGFVVWSIIKKFFRNDEKAYKQDYKSRLIVNEAIDRGYLEELEKIK